MPHNATLSCTATHANVAASASSVTLAAANGNRVGFTIFNDSTEAVYVKLGSSASTTSFLHKIAAAGYYELPLFNGKVYKGIVTGIWGSATGAARVTEFTES